MGFFNLDLSGSSLTSLQFHYTTFVKIGQIISTQYERVLIISFYPIVRLINLKTALHIYPVYFVQFL